MNETNHPRGLLAVHGAPRDLSRLPAAALAALRGGPSDAPDDVRAALTDLHGAFAQFVEKHDKRMSAVESRLDESASASAASLIGGGGGTAPAAALARGYDDLRAAMRGAPRAAMTTDIGPDGGFGVPTVVDSEILRLVRERSPLRRLATVVKAGSADYTKLIAERGAASGWRGERDEVTETDSPQLRAVNPPIGALFSYPSATTHMIADAAFDVGAFIAENVIDEFAFQESKAFVSGTGFKMPKGFATHATAAQSDAVRPWGTFEHVATGNAAGFASDDPLDELLEVVFKLRGEYRADPSCAWLMNTATLSLVRRMKDSEGRYLWQPSMAAGTPSTLFGYPIEVAEDMPSVADGALPIAFGCWRRAYLIVDRSETTVVADRFTKPGWVRYFFERRVGGHVMDTNAVKFIKIGA